MRSFGPLSTPRGRVDVEVHPAMLRLRPRHAWIDLGDYGEVLLVVGALAVGAAGLFLTAPLRYVCFGVAAVVVLGVLLLHLVAYAVAAGALVMTAFRMLTKDGRQRLRQSVSTVRRQLDVGPRELSRGDIVSVSPVRRRLRPRVRLALREGELVLTAWAWRRGQLEGLAQELRVSVAPSR